VLFDDLPILIVGRVLGGVALTLLWTVFESWMVTEYNARGLAESSLPISGMFGIMTTANCINAILAGVLAHCVVLALGSKSDPFIMGVVSQTEHALMRIIADVCLGFGHLRCYSPATNVERELGCESHSQ
jgi:MFS transporter, MFS domain-containing protein family, molybdate-anion transporter